VSPAFILIEQYLMRKICGILGYSNGDGIFCPGLSFVLYLIRLFASRKYSGIAKDKKHNGKMENSK